MKIAIIGRGKVGGGLGGLWTKAGHEVQLLGREGGDVSDADVLVVAVPSIATAELLARVSGKEGKLTIDASNPMTGRVGDFPSLAHEIKSIVGGPIAKSFNINNAVLYDRIAEQRVRPSNFFAAEDDARLVTERLIRDAGYDPVYLGGLEMARPLEDHTTLAFGIIKGGIGPFFYRIAGPGEL